MKKKLKLKDKVDEEVQNQVSDDVPVEQDVLDAEEQDEVPTENVAEAQPDVLLPKTKNQVHVILFLHMHNIMIVFQLLYFTLDFNFLFF
jgi:hypothetical protein